MQAFPLAAIRSESHLRAAQGVMDQLLAKGGLDKGEELHLDALSDLAAAYEDEHHAIEPASDADMLWHLMSAKGVNQAELHQATEIPKSTISEILSGKKPFIDRSFARWLHILKSIERFWREIFEKRASGLV